MNKQSTKIAIEHIQNAIAEITLALKSMNKGIDLSNAKEVLRQKRLAQIHDSLFLELCITKGKEFKDQIEAETK